jgi:hypothetical protein
MYVVFSLTGALAGGALGAVLGTAVATWCGAFVYWRQFVVALRASGVAVAQPPAPGRLQAVKVRR